MSFLELKKSLGDQLVFSVNDIKKIDQAFDYRRLTEWQQKGYLKKIIKGHYLFADRELGELDLFAVANRIYHPSYISLESALRHYDLIPEGVFSVTSVAAKKTSRFQTPIGLFSYRKVKTDCFFGYMVLERAGAKVKIALPEKAIIDYLYLRPDLRDKKDLAALRINHDSFKERVDLKKIEAYLKRIGQKSLSRRVGLLLKTMDYA